MIMQKGILAINLISVLYNYFHIVHQNFSHITVFFL